MCHTHIHSVIDFECVNSVSNRSKNIILFIIKVCIRFLLKTKIFTFQDLFTFTESIDKQRHNCKKKLLYVCGGEGYCELLVNFTDLLFIVQWR